MRSECIPQLSGIAIASLAMTFLSCGGGGSVASSGGGGGGDDDGPAMPCGPYPDQAVSAYVLPYEVGQIYQVSQGNCSQGSHRVGTTIQYAYDFRMPIGTPVVAARDGNVLAVEESFVDGNHTRGQENLIVVGHDDGSIGIYVHLTKDGSFVNEGDVVRRGDLIAASGNTGRSGSPHLHFHVQACSDCEGVPVTFLNTRPHPDGLVVLEQYTAEAY
jgi:murein DD-endopeptidase MepM/ murein hydrolase activator NlpD